MRHLTQKFVHLSLQAIISRMFHFQCLSLYNGELQGTSAELCQDIKIIAVVTVVHSWLYAYGVFFHFMFKLFFFFFPTSRSWSFLTCLQSFTVSTHSLQPKWLAWTLCM